MYKMDRKEFTDRVMAVQNSTRIFNNLTENNITKSFMAYQMILAERDRPIVLDSKKHGNRPPVLGDYYQVPRCPECQAKLNLRPLPPKGPQNRFGYGSIWWCPLCIYEKFNQESAQKIREGLSEIERKEEEYHALPEKSQEANYLPGN